MEKDDYGNELSIIKYTAVKNGYNSKIIYRIINKKHEHQSTNNHSNAKAKNKKFTSIEYGQAVHHF